MASLLLLGTTGIPNGCQVDAVQATTSSLPADGNVLALAALGLLLLLALLRDRVVDEQRLRRLAVELRAVGRQDRAVVGQKEGELLLLAVLLSLVERLEG